MPLKKRSSRRRGPGSKRPAKPVDDTALRELDLYAENTSELYPRKKAILANLAKKAKKGTYDASKAPKLWRYWVDDAAKRYRVNSAVLLVLATPEFLVQN